MDSMEVLCSKVAAKYANTYPLELYEGLPRVLLAGLLPYLSAYSIHRLQHIYTSSGISTNKTWRLHTQNRWPKKVTNKQDIFASKVDTIDNYHQHYLQLHSNEMLRLYQFEDNKFSTKNRAFRAHMHTPLHLLKPHPVSQKIVKNTIFDSTCENDNLLHYSASIEHLTIAAIQSRCILNTLGLLTLLKQRVKQLSIHNANNKCFRSLKRLLIELIYNGGILEDVKFYDVKLTKSKFSELLHICAGHVKDIVPELLDDKMKVDPIVMGNGGNSTAENIDGGNSASPIEDDVDIYDFMLEGIPSTSSGVCKNGWEYLDHLKNSTQDNSDFEISYDCATNDSSKKNDSFECNTSGKTNGMKTSTDRSLETIEGLSDNESFSSSMVGEDSESNQKPGKIRVSSRFDRKAANKTAMCSNEPQQEISEAEPSNSCSADIKTIKVSEKAKEHKSTSSGPCKENDKHVKTSECNCEHLNNQDRNVTGVSGIDQNQSKSRVGSDFDWQAAINTTVGDIEPKPNIETGQDGPAIVCSGNSKSEILQKRVDNENNDSSSSDESDDSITERVSKYSKLESQERFLALVGMKLEGNDGAASVDNDELGGCTASQEQDEIIHTVSNSSSYINQLNSIGGELSDIGYQLEDIEDKFHDVSELLREGNNFNKVGVDMQEIRDEVQKCGEVLHRLIEKIRIVVLLRGNNLHNSVEKLTAIASGLYVVRNGMRSMISGFFTLGFLMDSESACFESVNPEIRTAALNMLGDIADGMYEFGDHMYDLGQRLVSTGSYLKYLAQSTSDTDHNDSASKSRSKTGALRTYPEPSNDLDVNRICPCLSDKDKVFDSGLKGAWFIGEKYSSLQEDVESSNEHLVTDFLPSWGALKRIGLESCVLPEAAQVPVTLSLKHNMEVLVMEDIKLESKVPLTIIQNIISTKIENQDAPMKSVVLSQTGKNWIHGDQKHLQEFKKTKFSAISHLDISNNYIQACATEFIATLITNDAALKSLTIANCYFDRVVTILEAVKESGRLEHLNASGIRKSVHNLPCTPGDYIESLPNLITLDISKCQVPREVVESDWFCDAIRKHKCLRSLAIGYNGLETSACTFIKKICTQSNALKLRNLDIQGNRVTANDLLSTADWLRERMIESRVVKPIFMDLNLSNNVIKDRQEDMRVGFSGIAHVVLASFGEYESMLAEHASQV